MREEAFVFGNNQSLIGIITESSELGANTNLPAIILLNTGIIHRVGPNRLNVKIARRLTEKEFIVFRFDFSGIGDSQVRDDNLPFEKSAIAETKEAMDLLSVERGINRFILIGVCSGAEVAFQTACDDKRIVGGVLINALLEHPDNISDEMISYFTNRKAAKSYFKVKLFDPQSWLKFIKGKANYRQIVGALSSALGYRGAPKMYAPSGPSYVIKDLRVLLKRDVNLLLVYSEMTGVFGYFRSMFADEIKKISKNGKIKVKIIKQADHSFTLRQWQDQLLNEISNWAVQ